MYPTFLLLPFLILCQQERAPDNIYFVFEHFRHGARSPNRFRYKEKEIDFIMNYVDLMKLRYDDSTLSVNVSVNVANMQCKIAPMLYISIVENAFKYGASSKVNSSIDIDVSEDDSAITFVVTNTLLKDSEVNNAHKGGVGISNLKKRLDIIYPDCYEYTYGLTDDGKYRASIKLFNQKKI